jgi:hypothetical protein
MLTLPQQSGLEPESPFTFSQSSLQDYSNCPQRFKLRYVDGLVWPAVEAEPISEAEARQRDALLFHRMMQQHFLGLPPLKLGATAISSDLARWWGNFTSAGLDWHTYECHPEWTMIAPVGKHRLLCKYDLIALWAGKAMIYDWKTYARRPLDEWLAARWQTRVYRAMLVRAGAELNEDRPFEPGNISMIYWFAEFPTEPAVLPYDDQRYRRDWSAIEELAREISEAHTFPLTQDTAHCRFCVYRSLCDRGGQAGNLRDSQADDPEGAPFELDFEQIGEIEY